MIPEALLSKQASLKSKKIRHTFGTRTVEMGARKLILLVRGPDAGFVRCNRGKTPAHFRVAGANGSVGLCMSTELVSGKSMCSN